jgi:hypothetical protein
LDGANVGDGQHLTGYDQVKVVGGNVTIGSQTPPVELTTLNVTLNYNPTDGATFDIIDIGSNYTETGSFGNACVNFDVGYNGGTSNKDVILSYIYFGGD